MYRLPTIHPDLPAFSLSSAPLLLITPLEVSLQRDLRPESLGSPSSPRHNSLAFFLSQNLHFFSLYSFITSGHSVARVMWSAFHHHLSSALRGGAVHHVPISCLRDASSFQLIFKEKND